MADIKTTEEIGLELQKRKEENAAEVRTPELEAKIALADDVTDEDLKIRVHQILSEGVLTNVDVAQVVLPELDEKGNRPLAKFQFRRKRQNRELLKQSLKELGILDYIILKKEIGQDGVVRYYVLDGHTRFTILLELLEEDPTTLVPPFLVVECSDGDATLIADVLNTYSENLDSEDKPFAVIRMYELGKVPQIEIARRIGYSKSYVSQIVGGFQNVPTEAREFIESRKWSIEHGIQLARLKVDEDEQLRIFENAKQYRYSAEKLKTMVNASKERHNFKREAKKVLKENLAERKSKTVTTGDLEKIHEDALKEVYPDQWGRPQIAQKYSKEALEEIGYVVIEGEAKIEAKESPPEKPKMPSNKELMRASEWDHRHYICTVCGGKTHPIVAEALDFKSTPNYPKVDHDACYYQAEIERLQKAHEKTTIYKRNQEDPEFTLEQMNKEAQDIYDKELEKRKQAWREKNLPDPKKTVKKGTKVGEPVEDKTVDILAEVQRLRKKKPDFVPKIYWDPIEKHLQNEEGYQSKTSAAQQIKVKRQSFDRQLKKVLSAVNE